MFLVQDDSEAIGKKSTRNGLVPFPLKLKIDPQKAKFFMSICKQGNHSFVLFGLYDGTNVNQILAREGKGLDKNLSWFERACSSCYTLFSRSKALLVDEGIVKESGYFTEISYQAYDVSYQQYLEYLQILEAVQTDNNKYRCYKPVQSLNDGTVQMEYTSDKKLLPLENPQKYIDSCNNLTINNTCRHTAIELVHDIRKQPDSPLVSSSFMYDLPYETYLQYGKPCPQIPFYVLPDPPSSLVDMHPMQLKVLKKIYTRMENMLTINPGSDETRAKFLALKTLYTDKIGPQQKLSLNDLLNAIKSWRQDNNNALNKLRSDWFWNDYIPRKSTTEIMLDEIEADLVSGNNSNI